MENVKHYIESGILELYVLGDTNAEETKEVEQMAALHPEIRDEIIAISNSLEQYAIARSIEPDITVKPFLMAAINYMERMMHGEPQSFPPMIHKGSKAADYREWLDREDLALTPGFKDFYARIISYTPEALTAIVWIKDMAPQEMHDKELEKFLVLEGTCTIIIEGEIPQYLVAGDVLTIPLFKPHTVKITSAIPCKLILQRVAA